MNTVGDPCKVGLTCDPKSLLLLFLTRGPTLGKHHTLGKGVLHLLLYTVLFKSEVWKK